MGKATSDAPDAGKVLECGPLEFILPCNRTEILDFFCVFRGFDYPISDIAKNSGLSPKTGLREVRELEREGFIVGSKDVGKTAMFRLNADSSKVQRMIGFAMEVAASRIRDQIGGKRAKT